MEFRMYNSPALNWSGEDDKYEATLEIGIETDTFRVIQNPDDGRWYIDDSLRDIVEGEEPRSYPSLETAKAASQQIADKLWFYKYQFTGEPQCSN